MASYENDHIDLSLRQTERIARWAENCAANISAHDLLGEKVSFSDERNARREREDNDLDCQERALLKRLDELRAKREALQVSDIEWRESEEHERRLKDYERVIAFMEEKNRRRRQELDDLVCRQMGKRHRGDHSPSVVRKRNVQELSGSAAGAGRSNPRPAGPSTGVEVVDLTRDSPPRKRQRTAFPSPDEWMASNPGKDVLDWYDAHQAHLRATPPPAASTGKLLNPPTSYPTWSTPMPTLVHASSSRAAERQPQPQLQHQKAAQPSLPAGGLTPQSSQPTQRPSSQKRLRRWRMQPPQSYSDIKYRALTQRMFVLNRKREIWHNNDHPSEVISLAGTTGNVYTVIIDKLPSCDCPHALKGNQCKHIVYVLNRVLRAPSHLEFQLSFLSEELREIFAKAPPLPSDIAESSGSTQSSGKDGNRKPMEGECPICCEDLKPDSTEKIVYCKAACGNNVHAQCFGQWAVTKKAQDGRVTCPFCRAEWEGDDAGQAGLGAIASSGFINHEGYVNVATQLGLSGERDDSTYYRQRSRRNNRRWGDDDGYDGPF